MIDVTAQMVEVTTSRGRTKVGGRVLRMSGGESRALREPEGPVGQFMEFGDLLHLKEYPSTHDRDKALLVDLGVDGDVPLAQARINAGLDPSVVWTGYIDRLPGKYVLGAGWHANDNHELAAVAA